MGEIELAVIAYIVIGIIVGAGMVERLPDDASMTRKRLALVSGILTWPGFAISWLIRKVRGK